MATMTSSLILSLIDQVTGPARSVRAAIYQTNEAMERNRRSIRETQGAMIGSLAAGYALATAIRSPVAAAMEFESAMADVRKVVDFDTPQGFEEFKDYVLELARVLPVATNELAQLAAAGGEAGLRGEDLKLYVEAAAKLQTAFGVTADEAGTFMNSMRNALGLGMEDTILLADAVNHLSNNMAANAPALTDFMTRVAGSIDSFGLSAEQAAALGAAMLATGQTADVSATSFRNMGKALTRGRSATERQVTAFADLGLSATDVAERMQEDAVGTLVDVLDRIKELPKEMQAAVTSDLFGDEARALTGLIANTKLLEEAFGLVGDEADYAGSAYEEFKVRAETFESELQTFRNTVHELGVTLGNALMPALSETMDRLRPILGAVTRWADDNRALVVTITKTATALIGLRLGVLGLKLAGLYGKGGVLWLLASGLRSIGATSAAVMGAARSQMALSASLAAMDGSKVTTVSKIGAAMRGIAGVTGLSAAAGALSAVGGAIAAISLPVWGAVAAAAVSIGGAGILIWKNWDRISSIVSGVASALWEAHPAVEIVRDALGRFPAIGEAAGDAFTFIKDKASALWNFITGTLSGLFTRNILTDDEKAGIEDNARQMTTNIINAIRGLPARMMTIGRDAIRGLWSGMAQVFADMIAWVRNIPSEIASAVGTVNISTPKLVDKPLATVRGPRLPGWLGGEVDGERAHGGPILPGHTYRINERGDEFISPSRAAWVATAAQLRSATQPRSVSRSASGAPSNVTFSGDIILTNPAGASADELSREFGRRAGEMMRSHYSDAF